MLSRISIRSKITAVLVILLVAMTGMGLFAIRQMQAINANAVDIQTNWMPSVRVLGDLRAGVITYRNVIREHMLSELLEEKLAQEKTLETVVEANMKARQAYEKMITSPEERALYNEWVETWESYKKGAQEVMALSRKAAGSYPREAHELNTTTVNLIGIKSDNILKKDIDLNNKGADIAGQDATNNYNTAFMLVAIMLGAAVLIGCVVGFYLVRDVSRGITSIVTPMKALGEGDLTAVVPHQGEKTEIGTMADTLQVFKEALIAKKAADEAAAADADAKIARGQRVDAITRDFEKLIGELVGSLSSSSTELEAAANTLTSTAEITGRTSGEAAAASQEVSSNVQSVAVATEEITSSVGEISRQVQESSRVAGEAVRQAQKTDTSITELSQAAARIGDVVKLITAVAEQTNLLALNATIEAARAGDAGRGFAVVASEVKALAAQTAKATDEISAQVAGMQTATQESVATIKEIGKTITLISEISSTIAAAVEEQGAATQEIARNVQQAASLSGDVANSITDVSRGAGETGAASGQVLSAAQMLSTDSNRLKIEVEKFLTNVRAA
ncbi:MULTISPECIES: methyl-accepting chemotaxis protein [unclassified Afipia]|uniref:methyl-accepting chemotaxis protein n=1 Tax=unclassified Afipia TaxID=2642050 RepID=UPI000467DFED|nr:MULTISPECIES: methyl-accepting chemotaxis protein [unclassified Afipia]HAO43199.1 methyl-accepting chemotaxis protein [Afipia sp.]HAQ92854.1 methyl-accepting chemotaxis protein [Afipia sp.]HBF57045.1 methyl-accepting chemotaxis protein [Afipia sp.]HCX16923.1 methyl-accepting chemotaxis protein [Afipia sp.]